MSNRDQTLSEIAQHLDISPSDFKRAQERFESVKSWLMNGTYQSGYSPDIYLQGSFRLGTVVRPYRGEKDGDFDIDQVCEFSVPNKRDPKILKNDVGDRLKDNADYLRMLDIEGKRCWTLEYASEENKPGFHLDVLPALPSATSTQYQIDITNKEDRAYSWSPSNPKGYYLWFKSKNVFSDEFVFSQKRAIYEANREIYSDFGDVPKQLLRSPLQRAIQIMKRHRDVHFSGRTNKPISIIITTIATQLSNRSSITEIIDEFTKYVIERNQSLIKEGYLNSDGILDFEDGLWFVPNPVDFGKNKHDVENFADKWEKNYELAKAFFTWTQQLKRDMSAFKQSGFSDDLNLRTKKFGYGVSYTDLLKQEAANDIANDTGNNYNLLQAIHLGIEGKMEWEFIKTMAQHEYDTAICDGTRDVAKVNLYQIARHRKIPLTNTAIEDVKKMLSEHSYESNFVFCCNILLGTATYEMLQRCISEYGYSDVLNWPITRLFISSETKALPQRANI